MAPNKGVIIDMCNAQAQLRSSGISDVSSWTDERVQLVTFEFGMVLNDRGELSTGMFAVIESTKFGSCLLVMVGF